MIHEVRIALAQGGNGSVFGVAGAALEPLKNEHPVAFVLADAPADRLQAFAKGAGGFALAIPGVDLDAGDAGIQLLVGPHFRMEISQLHQFFRRAPSRADHLHPGGFASQGAGHLIGIE